MFDIVRRQIARSVPFARLLGISVDSLQSGQASAQVVEAPALTNHVGSLHAGVVFAACEAASGAALAGALLPLIMQVRFVVRDASITYLKPAHGRITARATVVDEVPSILDALQRDGRADVAVDVAARTADDIVVARATFQWALRR